MYDSIKDQSLGLNECVNRFRNKNEELIKKCKEFADNINYYKNNCNIAKSVGTGLSVLGAVAGITGVALIPLTGGLSLMTVGIVSLGGGLTGTAIKVGTEWIEFYITNYSKEINELAEERNKIAVELSELLTEFEAILAELVKPLNLSEEEKGMNNLMTIVKVLDTGKDVYALADQSVKLFEALKDLSALIAAKAAEQSGNVGQRVITLFVTESKTIGNGLMSVFHTNGLHIMGSSSAVAGKMAVQGLAATVGIVFTVVDVVHLVNQWNKNPSIDAINELIKTLESDAKLIECLNKFIKTSFGDSDNFKLIHKILTDIKSNTNKITDKPIEKNTSD